MKFNFIRKLFSVNAFRKAFIFLRWPFYAGLMFVLVSCGSDPFHAFAMKQTKEGPTDEGVANLKKSSKDHPGNIPYRQDYLRERERAVNQSLKEASLELVQGNLDISETGYKKVLSIDPDNAQAKQGLINIARKRNHIELIGVAR